MKKLLLILLLLISERAYATTYYADPTKSDANSCMAAQAPATAKATLTAAFACVGAAGTDHGGDTVIGTGTFSESLEDKIPSGTNASSVFTFKCLTTLGCTVSRTGTNYNIGFNTASHYIVIDGVVTTGGKGNYFSAVAANTFHDITFSNGEWKNHEVGMGISGSGARNITITNMLIHDIGHTATPCGPGFCHGIYISSNSDHWTVTNSTIYNSGGYGIQLNGTGTDDNTLKNNIIHDTYAGGHTIQSGDRNVIYNTVVYHTGTECVIGFGADDLIYNNTCYQNGLGSNAIGDGASTYGPGNGGINMQSGGGTICTNNLVISATGTALQGCPTSTTNITSGTASAIFTTPGSDFSLIAGASAIDQGTAIALVTTDIIGTTRPQNSVYDVGAYEFVTNVVPPACSFAVCETFDNYTAGTNLSGLSSGNGWTGNWTNVAGTSTVQPAPASGQGGNAANFNGTATYSRTFTGSAATTVRFLMYLTVAGGGAGNGAQTVSIGEASTGSIARITLNTNSDITAWNQTTMMEDIIVDNSSSSQVQTHWYQIDVQFDDIAQPDKYRVSVDYGAFTAWKGLTGTYTAIDKITIDDAATNTHNFYIDAIGGAPSSVTPIPYNMFVAPRIR